jgi:predicted N-formylglutamate amidohydrolase
VARGIARELNCTALLTRYSRLLIDVNRGADDPTMVMKLSDGVVVPANRDVDPFNDSAEFNKRRAQFYEPYHQAITERCDHALEHGIVPLIFSVHSFTPVWRGEKRPWHAGLLWDRDDRLAMHFLHGIRQADGDLIVGNNEPYSGVLKNDCLYRHGTKRGLPHVLLEIRQDLIASPEGQALWAARCASLLGEAIMKPGVAAIRHYGSYAD